MKAQPGLAAAGVPPPLTRQAYDQLRQALMEGLYQPGEPIVLQALANQLGTSVMPVREAVLLLAAERALELTSGRSARVPLLDRQQFTELCDMRMLLEGRAAELAARRGTNEEIDGIEGWHLKFQAAVRGQDTDLALHCNREFHFSIYRAAHQGLLSESIERLWLQCGPYFRAVFRKMTSAEGKRALRHHDDALAAIRKRDWRKAGAAIAHDIEESADWYRDAHGGASVGSQD